MTTTYSFSLSSHADTAPEPNLENGWYALFNPVTAETFKSLNTQLDQQQGWFTVSTATNGSTGSFHDVKASFNNFGGWPMSMQINIDCLPGPGTDPEQGYLYFGPSRNSTLVFGSSAGFIKGTYPASFAFNASGAAPYAIGITTGIQTYTKSDPNFSVPYGIYNCSGTWSTEDFISVCSVDATYSYSYNNTGTIALASTEQQTLAAYTNVGYCAANDGKGTVATFTDVSGTITITTHTEASDAAALAYVASKYSGTLPTGVHGFMEIEVTQNYTDWLKVTSANDGVFDWSTLPQEPMDRVTWAGLRVSSPMSTQALYFITAAN